MCLCLTLEQKRPFYNMYPYLYKKNMHSYTQNPCDIVGLNPDFGKLPNSHFYINRYVNQRMIIMKRLAAVVHWTLIMTENE